MSDWLQLKSGAGGVPVTDANPIPVQLTSSGEESVNEFWVQQAINVVESTYGDVVSVTQKKKDLLKFGRSLNIDNGIEGTVMTLPGTQRHETYVSTNIIDAVSSDNAADAGITLTFEGHTVSDGNFTFVVQSKTLNGADGRTPVTLDTPLARVTRIYNNTATPLQGTIYVYEDETDHTNGVPGTNSEVHAMVRAGKQQTEKCATTISSADYWFISDILSSVSRGSASNAIVDFEVQWRQGANVFRPSAEWTMDQASLSAISIMFRPFLIIPKNADVRLVATSDTNDTFVTGNMNGILASVVS